jgi:hypothetical protein
MSKIQKLFSFNQGRNIWRIILTDLDQIVIEERDIQKKEVYFSCIDRLTGKFFWKNKTFLNEKFWIGIEATISKYLILHLFEKPDMPNHKKIINVDLTTGEILWVNDDLTFYDLDENYVYGYISQYEKNEFFKISIEDGEVVCNLGNDEEAKSFLNSIKEKDYSRYWFTQTLKNSLNDEKLSTVFKQFLSNSFYSEFCEFIDRSSFLVFNVYDKVEPKSLINRLIVFDKIEEKPVLIETLNQSTPAPVPDSFFMYDDDLYFIKNKMELVAYRLNSEDAL